MENWSKWVGGIVVAVMLYLLVQLLPALVEWVFVAPSAWAAAFFSGGRADWVDGAYWLTPAGGRTVQVGLTSGGLGIFALLAGSWFWHFLRTGGRGRMLWVLLAVLIPLVWLANGIRIVATSYLSSAGTMLAGAGWREPLPLLVWALVVLLVVGMFNLAGLRGSRGAERSSKAKKG